MRSVKIKSTLVQTGIKDTKDKVGVVFNLYHFYSIPFYVTTCNNKLEKDVLSLTKMRANIINRRTVHFYVHSFIIYT